MIIQVSDSDSGLCKVINDCGNPVPIGIKESNSLPNLKTCQNKLISSERLLKILQNETKIIKIGQAILKIFNS